MKKKWVTVLLAFTMSLALLACGGNAAEEKDRHEKKEKTNTEVRDKADEGTEKQQESDKTSGKKDSKDNSQAEDNTLIFILTDVDDPEEYERWLTWEDEEVVTWLYMSADHTTRYIQYDFSNLFAPNSYAHREMGAPSGSARVETYGEGGQSQCIYGEVEITYAGEKLYVKQGTVTYTFTLWEKNKGKRLEGVETANNAASGDQTGPSKGIKGVEVTAVFGEDNGKPIAESIGFSPDCAYLTAGQRPWRHQCGDYILDVTDWVIDLQGKEIVLDWELVLDTNVTIQNGTLVLAEGGSIKNKGLLTIGQSKGEYSCNTRIKQNGGRFENDGTLTLCTFSMEVNSGTGIQNNAGGKITVKERDGFFDEYADCPKIMVNGGVFLENHGAAVVGGAMIQSESTFAVDNYGALQLGCCELTVNAGAGVYNREGAEFNMNTCKITTTGMTVIGVYNEGSLKSYDSDITFSKLLSDGAFEVVNGTGLDNNGVVSGNFSAKVTEGVGFLNRKEGVLGRKSDDYDTRVYLKGVAEEGLFLQNEGSMTGTMEFGVGTAKAIVNDGVLTEDSSIRCCSLREIYTGTMIENTANGTMNAYLSVDVSGLKDAVIVKNDGKIKGEISINAGKTYSKSEYNSYGGFSINDYIDLWNNMEIQKVVCENSILVEVGAASETALESCNLNLYGIGKTFCGVHVLTGAECFIDGTSCFYGQNTTGILVEQGGKLSGRGMTIKTGYEERGGFQNPNSEYDDEKCFGNIGVYNKGTVENFRVQESYVGALENVCVRNESLWIGDSCISLYLYGKCNYGIENTGEMSGIQPIISVEQSSGNIGFINKGTVHAGGSHFLYGGAGRVMMPGDNGLADEMYLQEENEYGKSIGLLNSGIYYESDILLALATSNQFVAIENEDQLLCERMDMGIGHGIGLRCKEGSYMKVSDEFNIFVSSAGTGTGAIIYDLVDIEGKMNIDVRKGGGFGILIMPLGSLRQSCSENPATYMLVQKGSHGIVNDGSLSLSITELNSDVEHYYDQFFSNDGFEYVRAPKDSDYGYPAYYVDKSSYCGKWYGMYYTYYESWWN